MEKSIPQTTESSFSKKSSQKSEINVHQRNIKKARLLLLAEALLIPIWNYFGYEDASATAKSILVWGGITLAIVYMAFSFFVSKKPFTIMLTALFMYIALLMLVAFFDHKTILSEFFSELIAFYVFYEGLREYKPAEKWAKKVID